MKSTWQQYINGVYAVPEFHFQSQLELYPFYWGFNPGTVLWLTTGLIWDRIFPIRVPIQGPWERTEGAFHFSELAGRTVLPE